ncbi:MAG: alanine racemase [Pseudomonadota bacterium]
MHTRPVWMEIDIDNLAFNCREVRKLVPQNVMLMGIVKDNAQGHGAARILRTMLENGINWFGVATLSEALQLRKADRHVPILILGYTPDYNAKEVIENDISQTVYSYDQAYKFSAEAKKIGKQGKLHIKLDTGMHRIGMKIEDETISTIINISKLPNVFVEGIFTHFAVADEDREYTCRQAEKFRYICDGLENAGLEIPIKHVSNSAAIMRYPEYSFDMVRPGRILFGYCLADEAEKNNIRLKKVMTLKTEVCHVKEINAGDGISYGLEYKAIKKSKIATLPIGYGDGFQGTGKIQILIKGHKVNVVGKITMDMCMVDVTGLDVKTGDEVIICAEDGVDFMTLDILMWASQRISREYYKDGNIIHTDDYVLTLS